MHPGAVIGAFLAGVFGVAVVALLVSKNSVTKDVLSSGGTALSQILQAATLQGGVGGNGTGAQLSSPGTGTANNPTQSNV